MFINDFALLVVKKGGWQRSIRCRIVGLGGTGSYVLDQVAKTPAREIHLFDGDVFLPHNAFRAPAAPSRDDLKAKPNKVTYLHGIYSRMHRHIVPHAYPIDQNTVGELVGMHFVFLCVDKGAIKELIVGYLEQQRIPFIDVGMGVYAKNDSLYGVLRVATGTPTSYAVLRQHALLPSAANLARFLFSHIGQIRDYVFRRSHQKDFVERDEEGLQPRPPIGNDGGSASRSFK